MALRTRPTYPNAVIDTNVMLSTIVKELVISRTGPRYIMGGVNHQEGQLPILNILKSYGWIDIQELGFVRGQWSPIPTCRGAKTIDYVFISPEMIPFFRKTTSWPWFADHVTLGAKFDFPVTSEADREWPQPSVIPRQKIQWEDWQQQSIENEDISLMGIDEAYTQIWQRHEHSFNGHVNSADGLLPSNCKGRAQRVKPIDRPAALPLLRPSRPGEVMQSSELLGRTPQKWFLQLRRLQSLAHALRAGKMTSNAQIYRGELWGSVLRGKGFKGGFQEWWQQRSVKLQGSTRLLPLSCRPCGLHRLCSETLRQISGKWNHGINADDMNP